MRFYPTADIDFYVQVSDGWDRHCKYSSKKSWRLPNADSYKAEPSLMSYWRDIEGAKKPKITQKDLYFQNWKASRIRRGFCLPLLYAMGERFIRLEKAYPAGFKCTPLPVGLAEFKAIRKKLRAQAKALKAWQKQQKKLANQCKGKKAKKNPVCKKLAKQQAKAATAALLPNKKK